MRVLFIATVKQIGKGSRTLTAVRSVPELPRAGSDIWLAGFDTVGFTVESVTTMYDSPFAAHVVFRDLVAASDDDFNQYILFLDERHFCSDLWFYRAYSHRRRYYATLTIDSRSSRR